MHNLIVNSKNHQSTKANCGAEKLYDPNKDVQNVFFSNLSPLSKNE